MTSKTSWGDTPRTVAEIVLCYAPDFCWLSAKDLCAMLRQVYPMLAVQHVNSALSHLVRMGFVDARPAPYSVPNSHPNARDGSILGHNLYIKKESPDALKAYREKRRAGKRDRVAAQPTRDNAERKQLRPRDGRPTVMEPGVDSNSREQAS